MVVVVGSSGIGRNLKAKAQLVYDVAISQAAASRRMEETCELVVVGTTEKVDVPSESAELGRDCSAGHYGEPCDSRFWFTVVVWN